MTPEKKQISSIGTTLTRFIFEQEHDSPEFAGQLSILLNQVAYGGKILAREISRAALIGKLGLIGERNATGDSQKKLDVYSDETIIDALVETKLISSIVTEEQEHVVHVESARDAEYIVVMDPLDGSSNTDYNGSLGTIFGIMKRKPGVDANSIDNFYRKGTELVVAGYVMYSTSTLLVYTTGHGVHGFTLDRDLGEFLLSHENIRCPERGAIYSANLAHYPEWDQNIRHFVDYLTWPVSSPDRKPHSLRYSGALVADFHRCLLEGGLYFYPPDPSHKDGKLRLMYECAPLGFIAEHAGGAASSGQARILDIQSAHIHERAPLAIGSKEDVALYDKFVREGHP
jgi:fructose-1,6-bisphosphatase I